MKGKLMEMKKAAQVKAAQIKANAKSKEGVSNTTETVMWVLVTVIIVAGAAVAINTVVGDESSGIIKTISDKFTEVQSELAGA